MEFKVGDAVFHPIHGVGMVVRLATKQFAGAVARQYYQVNVHKTTVWVPVETYATIGLRHLIDKPELTAYRRLLTSAPVSLDRSGRRLELSERVKQGSFQSLCEMVRDLSARGWRKPLGATDVAALRKTLALLSQEWAASDGVTVLEANQEIQALLQKAKQAHA